MGSKQFIYIHIFANAKSFDISHWTVLLFKFEICRETVVLPAVWYAVEKTKAKEDYLRTFVRIDM